MAEAQNNAYSTTFIWKKSLGGEILAGGENFWVLFGQYQTLP